MNRKTAIIFGATGQDGGYLCRLLVSKGYEVIGTGRSPESFETNLRRLGIATSIRQCTIDVADGDAVSALLAANPAEEIYYLAAQSSVAKSFSAPVETFTAAALGLLNVLEGARAHAPRARILNAASGDCFGETTEANPAREDTPFRPRSPYAAAKCAAHHALSVARLAHGQFACSAFLFNHESPLRPDTFVTGKIVAAVRRIAAGSEEKLGLGDVEVVRDWGWAPEYVEAMWLMLQADTACDFIVATGRSHSLRQFVAEAFRQKGLDWRQWVTLNESPRRAADVRSHYADASAIWEALGWRAQVDLAELTRRLIREAPAETV